LRYKFVCH